MKNLDLNDAPIVLLDDCRPRHKAKPSLLFHSPEYIIQADHFDELADSFAAIDKAVADGLHVAGWISYECAQHFEPKLSTAISRKANEPLIWMMATPHRETLSAKDVEILFHNAAAGNAKRADLIKAEPLQSEDGYLDALDKVHEFIMAGDVYQINHTLPIPVELAGNAASLYQKLRARQPVAYGAYIDTGNSKVLSLSPELFLEKRGSALTARPMKGTAPRGHTLSEDEAIQTALQKDPKSQAENLMIVDLIRNDLSRISEPGSVSVPNLFDVEQYPTLHQMTTTVSAKASEGLRPSTLLAAMFPCGSVTGAPKVRAMEIIQSLEQYPRGVYCGTIGHFSPGATKAHDNWCLNVPIRTLVLDANGKGRMSVGSGVVADSDPQSEYRECQLKAAFTDGNPVDFSLIETMKLENGVVAAASRHLSRLEQSALYFDFPFDANEVESMLNEHTQALKDSDQVRRVRLLLDKHGAISVTSSEVDGAQSDTAGSICLSGVSTNSNDPFIYHKTTHRPLYKAAALAAQDLGLADIIFCNEKGELTEGAISNLFIERNGILYTPPVDAGLLPGVLRAELLAKQDTVKTATLREEDLKRADRIYIGNALRGLRRVNLVDMRWQP